MATLVTLNRLNSLGGETTEALEAIRNGLAALKKRDGMRAQTIAVSAATFGEVFGIADAVQAQAMSDRLAAVNAGNYSGLSDLLDATIAVNDGGIVPP